MADEKPGTEEKEEHLREVTPRLEDEQRAWNGHPDALNRREIDERYNDARDDRSSLAWGAGGMQPEDRTESITSVLSEERSKSADDAEADGPAGARENRQDRQDPYQKQQREPDREAP